MKFKNLTKEQILISLDRLTRFKPTKEKYLRVFCDVILEALTEPSLKKTELLDMEVSVIRDYAQEIINTSIDNIVSKRIENDYKINNYLKEYENSVFNNDEDTKRLLDNKINYSKAIELIDNSCVVNLIWLKSIQNATDYKKNREINLLKFPIEKVILVHHIQYI